MGMNRKHESPTVVQEYRIAFVVDSNGDWDLGETFIAADDAAANAYAEAHYPGQEWYVLDADGENING